MRPQLFFHCTLRPIGTAAGSVNRSDEDIQLDLDFFSPFEELQLRTAGIMELKGIQRVYEPSPVPTLYVGRVEDLLGRVPLIPCFLEGNATSTIPHKYSCRQRDAFECCCADGAGPTMQRGSHIYEINTWLWNFGRYILYRKLPRFTTKLPRCTRKLPNSRFQAGMFYFFSGPK